MTDPGKGTDPKTSLYSFLFSPLASSAFSVWEMRWLYWKTWMNFSLFTPLHWKALVSKIGRQVYVFDFCSSISRIKQTFILLWITQFYILGLEGSLCLGLHILWPSPIFLISAWSPYPYTQHLLLLLLLLFPSDNRVLLCCPGWPQTCSLPQASEYRDWRNVLSLLILNIFITSIHKPPLFYFLCAFLSFTLWS